MWTWGFAAASIILSAGALSAAGICDLSQYWRNPSPDDFKRYTLAKVYDSEGFAEGNFHGNAFVLDADSGIFLTAFHVVKEAVPNTSFLHGKRVVLNFPNVSGQKSFEAEIVAMLDEQAGNTEIPRDLALLKIVGEVPSHLISARIALSEIPPAQATLYSYLATMASPGETSESLDRVTQKNNSEAYSACTLSFDMGPGHGESGAPLVIGGYVVGVILDFRDFGGRSFGEVMPLHCARAQLMRWAAIADRASTSSHIETLLTADKQNLSLSLSSDGPDDRISNFAVSGAIGEIISRMDSDSDKALSSDQFARLSENFVCPLYSALSARQISLSGKEIASMLQRSQERAEIKQIGDEYLRTAQRIGQDNPEASILAGKIAIEMYKSAMEETSTDAGLPADISPIEFATIAASRADRRLTAQTLKGLADSLLLTGRLQKTSAEIYGEFGDADSMGSAVIPYFERSAIAALASAAVSGDSLPKLGSSALATFAGAAGDLGLELDASEAYAVAYNNGFKPEWVLNSYELMAARGQSAATGGSLAKVPIDEYFSATAPDSASFAIKQLDRGAFGTGRNQPAGAAAIFR
ncbi:S1 family peptidase [Paracoccus marinaquae]|uniref:Serine protease n=1 Tax=Paracoccus marinaquae TaxID=2841926 RepID=A0ABS6ANR4_9RHOB|nr:serine protease [Paracoccus marinaquae]MBU3032233.1 serine protease [Paracoccus marinaquae]